MCHEPNCICLTAEDERFDLAVRHALADLRCSARLVVIIVGLISCESRPVS